jgi:hypothetical protein
MKLIIALLAFTALSGCGLHGEPILLARMYDSQDPCQLKNNGGRYPSFCGASNNRAYIYDNQNQQIGYTTNAPAGGNRAYIYNNSNQPIGYTKK